MNHFWPTIERWIQHLSKWGSGIAAIILFGLMLLTFMDVTGRYFIEPVKGTYELTELSLALIIFLGLAYTQQKKDHVSIDFIVEKFSAKTKDIMDLVTYTILIVLLGVLSWQMVQYGFRISERITGELQLPIAFFIILAALGVIMYALTLFLELGNTVRRVVRMR